MFLDRVDAGRRLAVEVRRVVAENDEPVVLGLPRGGVLVAREVAASLGAPLDVLVVRKVGAPRHPEFAVGAIATGGVRVVDPVSARIAGVTVEEVERLAELERPELERRETLYRGTRPPLVLVDRVVVVVDDGIATGATALAAVRAVRRLAPARVVLAVPVAARDWREGPLAADTDALVAVEEPRHLGAVGAFYADFGQSSDDEVLAALAR